MSFFTVYRGADRFVTFAGRERLSRMLEGMAIDPIHLTRQLVNIESTTYCEGLAGAFLHEFLTNQRYAVERMAVGQPDLASTPGAGSGERFNVYAAMPGVHAGCSAFHSYGHGASVLRLQRG